MDLFVGIIGWCDVTFENAARLLDDYLPHEPEIIICKHTTPQPGMDRVMQWMDQVHQDYNVGSWLEIESGLIKNKGKSVLIVIGSDFCAKEIITARNLEIPVLDLTKALYPVDETAKELASQMPLDGAVVHAEPLSEEQGTNPYPLPQDGDLFTQESVERMVKHYVWEAMRNHMNEYHPRMYIDGQPWSPPKEADKPSEIVEAEVVPDEETELYYYDELKGTYRRKGRRKIKPGEKEVSLTTKQAEELADKIS